MYMLPSASVRIKRGYNERKKPCRNRNIRKDDKAL